MDAGERCEMCKSASTGMCERQLRDAARANHMQDTRPFSRHSGRSSRGASSSSASFLRLLAPITPSFRESDQGILLSNLYRTTGCTGNCTLALGDGRESLRRPAYLNLPLSARTTRRFPLPNVRRSLFAMPAAVLVPTSMTSTLLASGLVPSTMP